jgi:hypothetical protein
LKCAGRVSVSPEAMVAVPPPQRNGLAIVLVSVHF